MAGKQHDAHAAPGTMRIEPVFLPEFGVAVSWAMCRNPMCTNFGIQFDGEIPEGRKQTSDDHYYVRVVAAARGRPVGAIQCRTCGQSSQLASNRAIRPIARYFLSLSLPFADCPNTQCQNHGVNLFEHWREGRENGPYRRLNEHQARCRACRRAFSFGAPLSVMTKPRDLPGKTRTGAEQLAAERQKIRQIRSVWRRVLEGVRAKRTVSDTLEIMEDLPFGNYYTHLRNLGARLQDYHAWRNAGLLRADIPNRNKPIGLYTDVLEGSLKADRIDRRFAPLSIIVTTVIVKRTIFVLAAHPCFLPARLCPDDKTLRVDHGRLDFETEWGSLAHTSTSDPTLSTDKSIEAVPDVGRGGFFIRSPYAELAHFLVVQKMVGRFPTANCFMDGAKQLSAAALVAWRDRILAGKPGADRPADRRRRRLPKAEIVLFQHHKDQPRKGGKKPPLSSPSSKTPKKALQKAWDAAEARFADEEIPKDLLKHAATHNNPRVRAQIYRRAFKGAYSKKGQWAWLRYPPESDAYRDPRTLWLTRMPGKSFDRHGKSVLKKSTLQPVDSIFDSARSRTGSLRRPSLAAVGRSYRESNALPSVVLPELAVYLLLRNYTLRRKTDQKIIPAQTMGLVAPKAARLDPLETAWSFRLGTTHARKIREWLKS